MTIDPSRRPIVRSSRLVHHRTVAIDPAHQVMAPSKSVPPPEAKRESAPLRQRRKHRFVRSVAVATLMSAGFAHADAPDRTRGGGLMGEGDTMVELADDRELAVAPKPEELTLAPRIATDEALGYKLEGLKDNPYLDTKAPVARQAKAPAKGTLVKKVPRARKVAWKKVADLEFQKVSDLKGNPYE